MHPLGILIHLEKHLAPNRALNYVQSVSESCHSDQLVKYAVNSGNGTYNMKKNDLYFATIGQTHGHRHRRADKFDEGKFDIVSEEIVRRRDHEHQGPSLQPIKRFDFNDTIIQRFFEYDETTLSNIVVEILDQRCQANYDSAFIEVFKMINKDDYEKKPLNERVFLFRKFLRLYKEYNDEMLRGKNKSIVLVNFLFSLMVFL